MCILLMHMHYKNTYLYRLNINLKLISGKKCETTKDRLIIQFKKKSILLFV